jgi:hypothetical protein
MDVNLDLGFWSSTEKWTPNSGAICAILGAGQKERKWQTS